MEPNPYQSPLAEFSKAIANTESKPSPSTAKSVFWSFALAILGGSGLLVAGYFLGRWLYDTDPPYWNDVNYPSGVFGDGVEEKVRIQTGISFAVNAGIAGFCVGLFAPWLRYAWLRYRR